MYRTRRTTAFQGGGGGRRSDEGKKSGSNLRQAIRGAGHEDEQNGERRRDDKMRIHVRTRRAPVVDLSSAAGSNNRAVVAPVRNLNVGQ